MKVFEYKLCNRKLEEKELKHTDMYPAFIFDLRKVVDFYYVDVNKNTVKMGLEIFLLEKLDDINKIKLHKYLNDRLNGLTIW